MHSRLPVLFAMVACCVLGSACLFADEKEDEERSRKLEAELAEIEAGAEKSPQVMKARASIAALAERIAKAERVEVYRLDPRHPDLQLTAKRQFHGHEVLAEGRAESAESRKETGKFVGDALHWNELRMALCFSPRHGMRVVSGNETLDLVICFECYRVEVYEGDKFFKTYALTRQKDNPLERLLPKAQEKSKDVR